MRAVVTPDDLKKGDLVEPGWYPAEIVAYEEGEAGDEAKNPGSTTCTFKFKILDGPSKGVQPQKLFSEVALGFGKALWKTLNLPFDSVKGYEFTTEMFKSQVGKKLEIYIKRGKSNRGNELNDVQDFRPMKG